MENEIASSEPSEVANSAVVENEENEAPVLDCDVTNSTAVANEENEAPGLDCVVEDADDGMSIDVHDDVVMSSPEPPEMDSYLPFQSLALELEEEDESPGNEVTSNAVEPSEDTTNTVEPSEDTTNIVEPSEDTANTISSEALSSAQQEEDSASCTPTPGFISEAEPVPNDCSVPDSIVSEESKDMSFDDSTLEDGNEEMNDASVDAPNENLNTNAKTYLEDFLISSASNSVPDSDTALNEEAEEKGSPLFRFPTIVKAMETADYEILQIVYRLLYLRNAWDTEKILAQRILEFSGFNCDASSEDYYTRLVMLRTMPYETIRRIAGLLCIEYHVKTVDVDKAKLHYISKIMKFLSKPKRARGRRRGSTKAEISVSKGKKNVSVSPGHKRQRKKLTSQSPKASKDNNSTVDVDSNLSACKVSLLSFSELNVACDKPGPLSYKLKVTAKRDDQLKEIEKEFLEIFKQGKAPEPRIVLKRVNPKNYPYRLVNSKTVPAIDDKDDKSSSATDIDTDEASLSSAKGEESSALKNTRKKLKEFAQVVSSIEGTPEELLSEVYMVLYLKKGETDDLKDEILDFDGFPFSEDCEEFKKRVECLNGMKEDIVKNVARALYMDPKSEKTATISHVMNFLKEPDDKLLRPTVIAPGMLSDLDDDIDFEGLSDSDDSITCEVVEKKVECIDLLSSGEESDKETKKEPLVAVKKEPVETPKTVKVAQSPAAARPAVAPTAATSAASVPATSTGAKKRTLRDFETITKIVNTHPTEYLVDIYNLLYMKEYEPSTLRKDILDFSGFEFEKGTPEYTKRKQFLDRMLYNSVRRIYNTLIHNTREVKVFSKPTMITEIFQFLFKLPDTDTSIRLPPVPRPSSSPFNLAPSGSSSQQNSNLSAALTKGLALPSQSGKLSDLKRVFQRVACFPCEYLVDVHKLLFMTDCEMKDIRANIFGFKGFAFDVDSSEFQQRKMYLEYLTFHSLRKISSVLTTKTVDLRNSTKHELANHLTEVLKEYCNTRFEPEPNAPTVPAVVAPATTTTTTTVATVKPSVSAPAVSQSKACESKEAEPTISPDAAIEQIVVTPIIEPLQSSPVGSPEPPANTRDDTAAVSSSTPAEGPKIYATFGSVVQAAPVSSSNATLMSSPQLVLVTSSPSVVVSSPAPSVSSTVLLDSKGSNARGMKRNLKPKKLSPPGKQKANEKEAEVSTTKTESSSGQQFADINLPELEKYRHLYEKNRPVKVLPKRIKDFLQMPAEKSPQGRTVLHPLHAGQPRPDASFNFRPEYVIQQVPQQFSPMLPAGVQLPLLHTYPPQTLHIPPPPPTFVLPQHTLRPKLLNADEYGAQYFAETVMDEDPDSTPPASKRVKKSPISDKAVIGVDHIKIVEASSLADKKDETDNPSSSLHMKIRDAMTKASEDEEDCDKPLATLVGHPNDKVLKQQICEIVEKTDLQEITINGVIQKIFSMYPKFNLNYRKEFIKSTLRSLLYRLGEQENSKGDSNPASDSPDCSVSTTDPCDSPELNKRAGSSSPSKQKFSIPTSSSSFPQKQSS